MPSLEPRPGGTTGAAPRPFLKWAGGKRQILDAILRRMPDRCATYHEPFVGGGAVFLGLAARSPRPFRRAVLTDRNPDLINAWRVVRDEVEEVVTALEDLIGDVPVSEGRYYEVRDLEPDSMQPAAAAARLIFMNRTCYNGLYRVNRSGRFNVPYGRYRNPRILDAANLRSVSAALEGVEVEHRDFEEAMSEAQPGDVVYMDPPYYPVSETARFTSYDALPFGPPEQERLAETFRGLRRRGVYALLSNSRVPATERLYEGFPRDVLDVRRAINSRGDRRGPVEELLVRTEETAAGGKGATERGSAGGDDRIA